jgi:hypothetical protein
MSLTLAYRWIFADWTVKAVRGEHGVGCYRLLLDVELAFKERPLEKRVLFTDVLGLITASGVGGKGFLATMTPAGAPVVLYTLPHSTTHQMSLVANLLAAQVESLETLRRGGELELTIDLRGQAQEQGQPESVSDSQIHRIPQGAWMGVLEQMGYGRSLLFEIPLPGDEKLARPLEHLEAAHKAMLRGEWRHTVALCRDVLEALKVALTSGEGEEVEEATARCEAMSKAKRFSEVEKALRQVANLAKHDDAFAQGTEWERRDARALLGAVAALVSRYAAPR